MVKPSVWLVALAAVCLAGPAASRAQQPARSILSAATLKRHIQAVADYDADATPELAIDSVAQKTTREVVAYLKAHALSAAEAERLGLELSVASKDAAQVRVYTLSYTSGGTRGGVSIPVLQWKNPAGQLEAYALPVACTFSELYRLASPGRSLYLLLGEERLNAPSKLNQAYVIELKGKYLLLNNAVFGREALLPLSNTPMEFEESQQALHLDLTDYDPEQQGNNPLAAYGFRGVPAAKKLTLYFRSGRFVLGR